MNGQFSYGLPERRNEYLSKMWEPYIRFKSNIQLKYEYYYALDDSDSLVYKNYPRQDYTTNCKKETADYQDTDLSKYKTPEEIDKQIDLASEDYRLVMQLKNTEIKLLFYALLMARHSGHTETQVCAAFKRLLQTKMPEVYFVTGDLERDIYKNGEREFMMFTAEKTKRNALVNVGFDVDTISLEMNDIPPNTQVLVLADPKTSLSVTALSKMQQYLNKGGNMLILGEPGKQSIVNPLLQPLGIQLMCGTLIEPSKDEMPHMVYPYLTQNFGNACPTWMVNCSHLTKRDDSFFK